MESAPAERTLEVQPGRINRLRILDIKPQGAFLEGDSIDPRILLPGREIPAGAQPGIEIDAFLYFDSEDRIIATTRAPYAMLHEFAVLTVVSTTAFGAFVDWGLAKDLLVPNGAQGGKMEVGSDYLIRVCQDAESGLLYGNNKEKYMFLESEKCSYGEGDAVSLLPYRRTKLGIGCLIDSNALGLLYTDEAPGGLPLGERMPGWIKAVRPDGRIDLQIRAARMVVKKELSDAIMQALDKAGGFLPLHDRSSPEEIQEAFQASKGKFRKALSRLYKDRRITLEAEGIRKV